LSDIVIIRSNAIIYSPRVRKIVKSLRKRYTTQVLGWNREGVSKDIVENTSISPNLLHLRAPFGKASMIPYYLAYWAWIFINLTMAKPKVVHACDLDSVIPCYIYKIIFRKKLVFDVCDRFAMAYISPKFKLFYSTINLLEELFAKHSDVLTSVSEKLLNSFQARPKLNTVIMNCSEEENNPDKMTNYDGKKQHNVPQKNGINGKSGRTFTLVYTGNIVKNRGLERITAAIESLHDVKLVIAGKPVDQKLLRNLLQSPNVEYRGLLQPADAQTLNSLSDAMVILYDLQVPNNNFSMSNKLFEAMMCGRPIITNVSTEIVGMEVGCGTVVDYDDLDSIKDAITSLRDDPLLCQKLGNRGREAFLQKYNWGTMEHRLFAIYENLL
jgi:glycosyltransferase involved in cell wall biosynthesis